MKKVLFCVVLYNVPVHKTFESAIAQIAHENIITMKRTWQPPVGTHGYDQILPCEFILTI